MGGRIADADFVQRDNVATCGVLGGKNLPPYKAN
jgi:hypothetical protein